MNPGLKIYSLIVRDAVSLLRSVDVDRNRILTICLRLVSVLLGCRSNYIHAPLKCRENVLEHTLDGIHHTPSQT